MRFRDAYTSAQLAVLDDLEARDEQECRAGIREPSSLKAIAPAVARLLYILVLQRHVKTIVEFGTSHGYSTIHLAAAAERTGGHVHTVDILPEKTAQARSNLERAGLRHRVSLATSDGTAFAADLPDRIDFVLVDYGIPAFMPAFERLRAKMASDCLLFVDGGPDGYWESEQARGFRRLLEEDPDFIVSVLPMHKEQLIAMRVAH